MEKKAMFVKSNDTTILEAALREIEEGAVISYVDLSKAIGRDVREHAAGCLKTARNILERDGLHTASVRTVGIKRLIPGECIDKARGHVTRARRAASRSRQTIETTDFARLDDGEKSAALAIAAQSGAMEMFGARKAEKRLMVKAAESSASLSIGQTLDLFSK